MNAVKVNETIDGRPIFTVTDGGKHYEVIGTDVRIVRITHGGSQSVRLTHARYAPLCERILSCCAA